MRLRPKFVYLDFIFRIKTGKWWKLAGTEWISSRERCR